MTQHQKILDFMDAHEWITPMECFSQLHITKLATRIGEIIRAGIPIESEWQSRVEEDGTVVRWKRYRRA